MQRLPLLIEVIGEPGVGKTHLSLTAPQPFIIDTTPKREALIIARKLLNDALDRYVAVGTYEQLKNVLNKVVKRNDVKYVIIDTGADLQDMAVEYEIEQKARKQLMPYEYGRIRSMIDDEIIAATVEAGKNLVMTAQMDDEYVEGKKTGKRVPKGYKRMAFQSDIRIYIALGSAEIEVTPGGNSFAIVKPLQSRDKLERKYVVVKNRFADAVTEGIKVLPGNLRLDEILRQVIPEQLQGELLI